MTASASPVRVVVFTTGGTIASERDAGRGGLVPARGAHEVVAGVAVPGVVLQTVELARTSSMAIRPATVLCWARQLAQVLARDDVAGAVLTTGTNAMEEVGFLLDLVHDSDKPLVVTGAMRPASHPAADGPGNLRDAILVASAPVARGRGVLVGMNGQVHAARHVRKASGQRLDAFVSPTLGPIGRIERSVSEDVVRLVATSARPAAMRCEALEERIALIAAAIGIDSRPIHDALDAGARALVIEAFAGGDLTPQMADGVQRARRAGLPVVVASRGWCADPTDAYAGLGEGAWLRAHGVLLARGLSAHKARLLLMVTLGAGQEHRLGELLD